MCSSYCCSKAHRLGRSLRSDSPSAFAMNIIRIRPISYQYSRLFRYNMLWNNYTTARNSQKYSSCYSYLKEFKFIIIFVALFIYINIQNVCIQLSLFCFMLKKVAVVLRNGAGLFNHSNQGPPSTNQSQEKLCGYWAESGIEFHPHMPVSRPYYPISPFSNKNPAIPKTFLSA